MALCSLRFDSPLCIDHSRDVLLTDFSRKTLEDRYLMPGERCQDLFARVATAFSDDRAHAQRLYDYMSRLWFMPATPVLSNGGTTRGLPISCYLNECQDDMQDIVGLWNENVWLASQGGGIGSYWGNLRSLGEKIGQSGRTTGIIPFIRVMDTLTLAISQGSLRRGSAAVYLPVEHPEIEEFIELRRPTGGDPERKAPNIHHGVVVSDAFMKAVEQDASWPLISPRDGHVIREISARDLWVRLLTARMETGEPYLLFIDHVNRAIPEHHKRAGLKVKTSNLCSEITLPTGPDGSGQARTAVCCLSSLNLEHYDAWHGDPLFLEDIFRFLDNVLQDYIDRAPTTMERARYAASQERSIGLGVMGWHSFLQQKNIPFESVLATSWNKRIFSYIKQEADQISKKLAQVRGPCPDAARFDVMERFSNKLAIAPTASISIIASNASPGIEPIVANSFTHKTLSGSTTVRNKYLERVLDQYGLNTPEVWSSISLNQGSVQHIQALTEHEKLVFKTAFEIDQRWVIEHAADRTPYICQAQSLNVFCRPDIHKKDLHQMHYMAWKKGVKSLYYLRSQALSRAESAQTAQLQLSFAPSASPAREEECLSCQ